MGLSKNSNFRANFERLGFVAGSKSARQRELATIAGDDSVSNEHSC